MITRGQAEQKNINRHTLRAPDRSSVGCMPGTARVLKISGVKYLVEMTTSSPGLGYFKESYEIHLAQLNEERAKGMKVVGTFCLFVPDEIIFAAGADRVILCGGRSNTIPLAEQSLPRTICPLIKSSSGAIVDACNGGTLSCPHVGLVDAVVGEATCDGKTKTYELLPGETEVVADDPQCHYTYSLSLISYEE